MLLLSSHWIVGFIFSNHSGLRLLVTSLPIIAIRELPHVLRSPEVRIIATAHQDSATVDDHGSATYLLYSNTYLQHR
jgi:hypothetical protein